MLQVLNIILFSLFFGFFSSHIAKRKNRRPVLWFYIGFSLGIIALAIIAFLPKIQVEQEQTFTPSPSLPRILEKNWYFLTSKHEQSGPHPCLKAFWQSKEISENSLIWAEGMEDWKPLKHLPELYRELSN